jgi:hypothetical protein
LSIKASGEREGGAKPEPTTKTQNQFNNSDSGAQPDWIFELTKKFEANLKSDPK